MLILNLIMLMPILSIILLIIVLIFYTPNNKYNNIKSITANYIVLKSPMTGAEQNFYKELKKITDKYNLTIIPQIMLQKIFLVANKNDISSFNKIKSKSIDFAIIDEKNEYKLFIELDDSTHKYYNRLKRDEFVNELFKDSNYTLLRIKTNNYYNLKNVEEEITQILKSELEEKKQKILKKYI